MQTNRIKEKSGEWQIILVILFVVFAISFYEIFAPARVGAPNDQYEVRGVSESRFIIFQVVRGEFAKVRTGGW